MRKPDVRAAPAPRLQFTQEELNTPEIKKPLRKVQKAADKRDAARAKLPQQKKLGKQLGNLEAAGFAAVAFFDNEEIKVLGQKAE